MTVKTFAKRFALASVVGLWLAPGTAHAGFLDELFGGGAAPAPAPLEAPSPRYEPTNRDLGYAPVRRAQRVHKKLVAVAAILPVDRTPKLQKTTDLMSDKTLRTGDAVMMKSGLHIYDGPKSSRHEADEFVALDRADISKKTRNALAAMDMTRRAPMSFVASASLKEGRSASGQPIAQGYKITDGQGRSIRYVGP